MTTRNFKFRQLAVIERGGGLMVLCWPNRWPDFPRVPINEGEEEPGDALRREIREETTLEVAITAPFATWLGRAGTVLLVGYRCSYVSGEVTLSDEHNDFRWVDRSDFRELDDGSPPFAALVDYFET